MKVKTLLHGIAISVLLYGCGDLFDFHPYDTRFNGEQNINANNIKRIEADCLNKDTLTIAFISDTHGSYGDTEDMVDDINNRNDADFVIHGGDLTDCGTTKEFIWQRKRLAKLRMPYVALIGNHDFLGTGNEVYSVMYGNTDFSFIAGRIKFICLNTNATEYDYLAAVPNFDFMETQILSDTELFDRTIVCMHARPYSEQFNNNVAKSFQHYILRFPGIMFCLNGHDHCLQEEDIYGDGLIYYGAPSASRRSYLLFKITPTEYHHEVIYF
ncbi:metallophosphoesterase family protein [Xylanibacter muris]|uniref:Metallophosphoesterase n=1 Tax=Xylanibacter muris TaxID=2736290 RepID=A0ABX2AJD7_9BACT|nr:metallophosphoesterase [Xylanibacter muris]NPD91248.1 metallophosphoesterase [Xylanibacter muris]